MLQVFYDKETLQITAWRSEGRFGMPAQIEGGKEVSAIGRQSRENEDFIMLDIEPPAFESDKYFIDLDNKTILGNPDYHPIPTAFKRLEARVTELEQKV